MTRRRTDGNETWSRLLEWNRGQAASERLAAHVLRAEGYKSIDPSHPLGGADGLKDVLCERDSLKWIGAAYFPRGKQPLQRIEKKLRGDLEGVVRNAADGIVFVTNQELRLAERETLKNAAGETRLELFHLERVASLLDSPHCYGLRLEFLDIEMTREEQLSFISTRDGMIDELKSEMAHLRSDFLGNFGRLERRLAFRKLAEDSEIGSMVLVPSGSFLRGSKESDVHHFPSHEAHTNAFHIDRFPVTNGQFKEFIDDCPEWGKEAGIRKHMNVYYLFLWQGDMYPRGGKDHPVVWVNWLAAAAFCNLRSEKNGLTPCYDRNNLFSCAFDNDGFRLPTEMEFEKAARGGQEGLRYPWGNDIDEAMANYGIVVSDTTKVGKYPPNALGIFDIVGNVKEWCHDWYQEPAMIAADLTHDRGGPDDGEYKVFKGGSWGSNENELECAFRAWLLPQNTNPDMGFRAVTRV